MTGKERGRSCRAVSANTRRLFIPQVKAELGERTIAPVRNDTLDFSFKKPAAFSGAYRNNPVLYDLFARKYGGARGFFASGDERFILGPKACGECLTDPPDPQLEKIAAFLRRPSCDFAGPVYAICLLGIDESDENRQAFVLIGNSGILLRDSSLASYKCPLEEAEFSDEGLILKNSNMQLDWVFDERFLAYVREIYGLRFTWPKPVPVRHPFMDLALKQGADDAGVIAACLDFCIDVIARCIDLSSLLLLESMVALFRLPEAAFLGRLKEAVTASCSKNELMQRLNTLLNRIGPDYREVFFLFLLELCGASDSDSRSRDLLEILRRDNFAGREFVDAALRFRDSHAAAQRALAELLTIAPGSSQGLVAHTQYIACLGCENIK